jgi:sugar phosphate isomerase/epimerase
MFKNLSTELLGISGTASEIVELVLSHNFKGLDLDVIDFAEQVKAGGLPKARRMYDSARLKFTSFRLPVEWHEDSDRLKTDLAALPNYLQLAKDLGCKRAITTIEPAGDIRPFHENFEYHRRRLGELATATAPFDISLGIEFLAPANLRQGRAFQFIQSVDQLLMLFKMLSVQNVGLVLDTWHWHLGGGTIDQIRALQGKIVAVYLADCDPNVTADHAPESARRLPGETGVIDCPAILSALAETGYNGPVTPAPYKGNLIGQSRDSIVKAASGALDACWKAAGLNAQGKLTPAAK